MGRDNFLLLETATDAVVLLQELDWRKAGMNDEALAPELQDMYSRLRALSDRSLRESLEHTDPKALFDLVRYAKHLGLWRGYEDNRRRLKYLRDTDEDDRG